MRESPAYQSSSTAGPSSVCDEYPAPTTCWNLNVRSKHPSTSHRSNEPRNSSSTTLLKTALANRLSPIVSSNSRPPPSPRLGDQRSTATVLINGRPPTKIHIPNNGHNANKANLVEDSNTKQNGEDEMSKSILRNGAWYRDSDGRTGFQPVGLVSHSNVQQTEIKPQSVSRSPTPTSTPQHRSSASPPAIRKFDVTPQRISQTPIAQPRSSSLSHRFRWPAAANGSLHRANSDVSSSNTRLLPRRLERRGSTNSESSRGSTGIPKSVTFCEEVVVNEIDRTGDGSRSSQTDDCVSTENDDDAEYVEYSRTEDENDELPLHAATLLKWSNEKFDEPSEQTERIPQSAFLRPPSQRIRSPNGANFDISELRNSPSLDLDAVCDEAASRHPKPHTMRDNDWRLLQSIYVPAKDSDARLFQPISVDIETQRSFGQNENRSPHNGRRVLSPNQTHPMNSPLHYRPSNSRLPIKQNASFSPHFHDLRAVNRSELIERESRSPNRSTTPTRQYSVVPPDRSTSPLGRQIEFITKVEALKRQTMRGREQPIPKIRSSSISSPSVLPTRAVQRNQFVSPTRSVKIPVSLPTMNGYDASDESTLQNRQSRLHRRNDPPIKLLPPQPQQPVDSMILSFYDNVNLQQNSETKFLSNDTQHRLQQRFLSEFASNQRSAIPIASPDDSTSSIPSDPEITPFDRKCSNDSSISRESVVSATSYRAESKLRRNFNY
ncbi:hypothetical protein M3Y98_01124600 [Aphelenchoides besseyi]|nr:hypothetical protein M3Y98_01124600 [Aphelenchoides besseyi]